MRSSGMTLWMNMCFWSVSDRSGDRDLGFCGLEPGKIGGGVEREIVVDEDVEEDIWDESVLDEGDIF